MRDHLDFGTILEPVSVDDFISRYFEKQPLHIERVAPEFYAQIPTLAEFERLVRTNCLGPSELRLARQNSNDRDEGAAGSQSNFDPTFVFQEFQKGSSLVLDRTERHFPFLRELCRAIELFYQQPVTANAVITPAMESQGFDLHFDFQDVFVLQLHGRKRWLIYEPQIQLPLPEQFRFPLSRPDVGPPIQDVVLNPGDFLYVPRGFPHEARTLESESLQVGLGLFPQTVADVAAECFRQLAVKDDRLREPASVKIFADAKTANPMSAILEIWENSAWLEALEDSSSALLRSWKSWAKPTPEEIDAASISAFETHKNCQFKKADPDLWKLEATEQHLIISAPGFEWTRPLADAEIYQFIMHHDKFAFADIPSSFHQAATKVIHDLVAIGALQNRRSTMEEEQSC